MKLVCLNCRSAFRMIALKGDKAAVDAGAKKVTTRCPVCCDVLAYTAHDPPQTESEKDRLRVIVLHDHLWPRATTLCGLARQEPKRALMCIGCPHEGKIDAGFCGLAKQYADLLIKTYPEDEKDDEMRLDEDSDQQEGDLTRPIEDYAMPGDDE